VAVDRDGLWVIEFRDRARAVEAPAICAVPASVVTTALVVWPDGTTIMRMSSLPYSTMKTLVDWWSD